MPIRFAVFLWAFALTAFNACATNSEPESHASQHELPLPVTITLSDVNFTLDEDERLDIVVDPEVTGSEAAPAIAVVSPPEHGTLTGDGLAWSYAPDADFNGTDRFTLSATVGDTVSRTATVTLTVLPVNDPPSITGAVIAAGDYFAGSVIAVEAVGWSDVDGDAPGYRYAWEVNGVALGSAAAGPVLPATFFAKNDTVVAVVTPFDGTATGAPAQSAAVVIRNSPPDAWPISTATFEDEPLTAPLPVTDADLEGLAYELVTAPTLGNVTFDTLLDTFTYSPAGEASGPDGFGIRATDGTMWSPTVFVAIAVTAVNDAPVAWPAWVTTAEEGAFAGTVTGTDVDSGALTYALAAAPANGTLSLQADGAFTFTPAADFTGADAFTFTVSDGLRDSAPATVAITVTPVNDPPAVTALTFRTLEGVGRSGTLDVADPDTARGTLALQVAAGARVVVVLNDPATGSFSYTPANEFAGQATFAVRAFDGELYSPWVEQIVYVTDRRAAASSSGYACATTSSSDEVYCWGNGYLGTGTLAQSSVPVTTLLNPVAVIDGSGNFTCAVSSLFELWCWGSNNAGRTGLGTANGSTFSPSLVTGSMVDVAVGDAHACGIGTDGSLWCWGGNQQNQVGVPGATQYLTPVALGGTDWIEAAAGSAFSCAIRAPGTLWCWGLNNYGQLALGLATSSASTPTQVGADSDWASLFAGSTHACATKTDGTLWCWGASNDGSNGQLSRMDAPTQLGIETDWRAGAASGGSCAIKTDGSLWCWGPNASGELGIGFVEPGPTPTRVGTHADWASIDMEGFLSCGARRNGQRLCWGSNWSSQTGTPAVQERWLPAQVGGATWASVSGGDYAACGMQSDGTPACWGANNNGQYGIGIDIGASYPVAITTDTDWALLEAGRDYNCAVRADGSLWCAGDNGNGQLGNEAAGYGTTTWIRESTLQTWAASPGALATGDNVTCGVTGDQDLYCWGYNGYHAVSSSTEFQIRTPSPVSATTDWSAVTIGYGHVCALKVDGSLWCWGENRYGQLGLGPSTGPEVCNSAGCATSPREVTAGTSFVKLASGDYHSCAIRTDGTLWCWGFNHSSGPLGTGSSPHQCGTTYLYDCAYTPVQVGAASDWLEIAAGSMTTCGIRGDGTSNALYCWGDNFSGKLGLGDEVARTVPTQVDSAGPLDWKKIEVSAYSVYGLRGSGVLWSWGDNGDGTLGDGTAWLLDPAPVPIP
jgi:VCBS repeat-containing protein